MLYLRFAGCLAVGLFGVGMVLMVLIDALFTDWDVVTDLKIWVRGLSRRGRRRYVLIDDERYAPQLLATRLQGGKAQALREKQFLAPLDPDELLSQNRWTDYAGRS